MPKALKASRQVNKEEVFMANTVLVTGATGNIGSGLVPALLAAGVNVRALVRRQAKAEALRTQGAQVVIGDLDDLETLPTAVSGVDKVFLLTWNGPTAVQQASNLIQAARQSGTPHIVRAGAHGSEKSRIVRDHMAIERLIKSSGLPYTILRPTFFMQNVMMAAQTVATQGRVYMPFKDGKLGMIDVRDILDVAVKALTMPGHEGKTYVLTGPRSISFHDVAATLSVALDKNVTYMDVPLEAAKQAMMGMGMPEWIADGYLELMSEFANNWGNGVSPDVEKLSGHPARSIERFARDFAHVFGGSLGNLAIVRTAAH
jgi:uncharacterized protein YbjT (DUF2867 family)